MSSRNLTVKTIKHNNNNNNNHHSSSFVASSKSSPTVSKYQKNHSHTNNNNSIQQPKKNNNQKLQATNKNSRNNHGRNKQNNKKVVVEDDNSSTSSSSSEEESSPRQNQKTMRKKQQFEYKSFVDQVYAGPTFNNAPLPSALPIPAFNARGSPINYHPQPLYYPHSVNNPTLQQQSMDLMNLITPQKVVTAYELEKTNLALSEIQRGLRSMLKIES